jgi:short-subunit dehydrogenase
MENYNKTALVTGTSSGIGKATAIALKEAGFFVYATAPDFAGMEDLTGDGFELLQLDVTNEEQAKEAIKTAESRNGSLQVLVNNAGYGQYGPVEEIPIDAIRKDFEVNVFGLIRLCQLALPGMRKAGSGRIINISSVAGEMSQPGAGVYHATKHAVEAIDEALRIEVETFGVKVIGVLPGPVNTNFDEVAISTIPETGADSPYYTFKENLKKTTKQMLNPENMTTLEPEDVAKKVVEAATDENPERRYHVGVFSKVMGKMHDLTPDAIWDKAMEYMVPTEEKKSASGS